MSGLDSWQDTFLDVKPGDRVHLSCAGGSIAPWPGHIGFDCHGDGAIYWPESIAESCPFMQLVYLVGGAEPFCFADQATNHSGRLYLAPNDGVNFSDNSGVWTAMVNLERPYVGMPFAGKFGSTAAPPATHTVNDSDGVSQWATDLYAVPGTKVRYLGAPWMTASVSRIQATPCAKAPGTVGKTVFVELYNNSNGASNRIGRAVYSHLDGVTVAEGATLASGQKIGTTKKWNRVESCYDVANNSQVHVHFQLGTHPNAGQSTNYACWKPGTGDAVAEGAKIGWYGTTGLTSKQRCSSEP